MSAAIAANMIEASTYHYVRPCLRNESKMGTSIPRTTQALATGLTSVAVAGALIPTPIARAWLAPDWFAASVDLKCGVALTGFTSAGLGSHADRTVPTKTCC